MQVPQIVPSIEDLNTIVNGVNHEIAVLYSESEWTQEKCKALISTLDYSIKVLNAVIALLRNYQTSAKKVMLSYASALNNIKVAKVVRKSKVAGTTHYIYYKRYYVHKDCSNLQNDIYELIGSI